MALKILAVIIILAMACRAQNRHPFPVSVPGFFYDSANMEDSNCANLTDHISLNFSKVGLRRLDSFFTSSPKVICLSFEDNEIDQVSPSSFSQIPNLLYLSLARNRLDFEKLTQLEGHRNLRTLVLDENWSANFTEGPVLRFDGKFPRLLFLHAVGCGIRDVASLAFAPRLMHLYLARNDLAASSLAFLEEIVENLRILDLSENRLQRFDAGSVYELRVLHLDGNRFERLCSEQNCDSGAVLALAGLKKLTHLTLARNAIADVESYAFDDALELEHLDLSDNRIRSIDDGTFKNLIKLKNLTLKGNLLSQVPDIRELKVLHHLSLASNDLEVLRNGSFFGNVFLISLNLSNNKIATVESGAFERQHYLESLDLSNNKLSNFTNMWLKRMYSLRVLYIKNNLLTTLDNLYLESLRDHTAHLKEIYLQNNQITKFNFRSFNYHAYKHIPDISFIFFDTANFTEQSKNAEECTCDCSSNDIDIKLD